MQHEQPVIWILSSGRDKIMEIDEKGNNTPFSQDIIDKAKNFELFSLYDVVNDLMYSINLKSGEVLINGVPMKICKEVSGRPIELSNRGIDYSSGIIQYKECFPIPLVLSPVQVSPMTFNIGYKVSFDEGIIRYSTESFSSSIINMMFLLTLHIHVLKPMISISITEKRTMRNGETIKIRV